MTRRLVLALWLLLPAAAHAQEIGVLILAHGGTDRWNETVRATVEEARLPYPTAIAFGMGMHLEEVARIQQALDELNEQGARRVIAIPLLISSTSEVMRQFEYLLGLRPDGHWQEHAQPVTLRGPVTLTTALDDDPAVAEVLTERAAAISEQPQQESVVLVAHGPVSEDDDARWLAAMERLGRTVHDRGGFRAVVPVTMRDDASEAVREAATRRMRQVVEEQARGGRVLVVPLLLANGGIEQKIPKRLEGLPYTLQEQALLPHPKLAQWIAHQVALCYNDPSE